MHFLLSIRRHRITPMLIGPSSRQPGSSHDCGVLVEVAAEDIGDLIMAGKKLLHLGVAI
jgi:hypothetical protein